MITSTSNSQVKQAAALAKKVRERRQTGLFLVEGRKMYEEAPRDWLEKVYVTERYMEEYGQPEAGVAWETVTDEVMKAMADTQTPQGVLALVRQPKWRLEDVWKGENPHIIMLETLQDPGNLGTILRAGEGAGITGLIMNRDGGHLQPEGDPLHHGLRLPGALCLHRQPVRGGRGGETAGNPAVRRPFKGGAIL